MEPIDTGDNLVATFTKVRSETGRQSYTRRCTGEIRRFLGRALGDLEHRITEEEPHPTLDVPMSSFQRLGIMTEERALEQIDACPESYYIRAETTDDHIRITLENAREIKTVAHYNPKYREEDL